MAALLKMPLIFLLMMSFSTPAKATPMAVTAAQFSTASMEVKQGYLRALFGILVQAEKESSKENFQSTDFFIRELLWSESVASEDGALENYIKSYEIGTADGCKNNGRKTICAGNLICLSKNQKCRTRDFRGKCGSSGIRCGDIFGGGEICVNPRQYNWTDQCSTACYNENCQKKAIEYLSKPENFDRYNKFANEWCQKKQKQECEILKKWLSKVPKPQRSENTNNTSNPTPTTSECSYSDQDGNKTEPKIFKFKSICKDSQEPNQEFSVSWVNCPKIRDERYRIQLALCLSGLSAKECLKNKIRYSITYNVDKKTGTKCQNKNLLDGGITSGGKLYSVKASDLGCAKSDTRTIDFDLLNIQCQNKPSELVTCPKVTFEQILGSSDSDNSNNKLDTMLLSSNEPPEATSCKERSLAFVTQQIERTVTNPKQTLQAAPAEESSH